MTQQTNESIIFHCSLWVEKEVQLAFFRLSNKNQSLGTRLLSQSCYHLATQIVYYFLIPFTEFVCLWSSHMLTNDSVLRASVYTEMKHSKLTKH